MATEIELIPDGKRLAYIKWDGDKPVARARFDPMSEKARYGAGHVLGVDDVTLLQWAAEVEIAKTPKRFVAPHDAAADRPGVFTVREIDQARTEGRKYDLPPERLLREVLPAVGVEQVVDWTGRAGLCCLDIDYHEKDKDGCPIAPARHWLESVVTTRLAPRPLCWHFSKGGGLHLFYVGTEGFRADELAAVAALRFRSIDVSAEVELKTQIRGPGADPVRYYDKQDTTGLVTGWLAAGFEDGSGDIEDTAATYRAAHDLEIGKRYSHDKCPIAPSPDAGDKRSPVVVNEAGIHCFLCESKNQVRGSRRPGFVPWSVLVDHPTGGLLGDMIRRIAHWGHARHVLREAYGLDGPMAKLAYVAALKAVHQGTDRYPLIANVSRDTTDGYAYLAPGNAPPFWYDMDTFAPGKDLRDMIAAFPAVQYVTAKGEVKPIADRLTKFLQVETDLTRFGYPKIQLINGAKIAGAVLNLNDGVVIATPQAKIRERGDAYRPRYVPRSSRMKVEAAWTAIEQIVPRVDRSLIELLIAGAAVVQEGKLGPSPRVFVAGSSGTAKTAHFGVASGILGTSVQPVRFDRDETRMYQAIRDALDHSPIVPVSEIFKDAARGAKLDPIGALSSFLNLDKHIRVHRLYKGSEPVGREAMLGFTEISLPLPVRDETQLARRLRYVRLYNRKHEWPSTMAAAGVGEFHLIRLASPEVAAACNAILSDVADRFFDVNRTFEQIADMIGVPTVETSADFADPLPYLREFFRLICAAPDVTDPRLKRMIAPGFKKIVPGGGAGTDADEEDLAAIWTMFADHPTGERWFRSEKLESRDWAEVLKVEGHVKIVIQRNGDAVFVRFQIGPLKKPLKVNAEIVNPEGWKPL